MFRDRIQGAVALLPQLHELPGADAVVLGLPRGGVPVAAVVAEGLGVPLDVVGVRKLGLPFHPEVAMGAIAEGGAEVLHRDLISHAQVSPTQLAEVERRERMTLQRRIDLLRRVHPPIPIDGRTVIVVDDGVATGGTAEAACRSARARGARSVVFATPVGPGDIRSRVPSADSRRRLAGESWRPMAAIRTSEVSVPAARGGGSSAATLGLPSQPLGFVILAHGIDGSRGSRPNRIVAAALNRAGFGTLLMHLTSSDDGTDPSTVSDIARLGERLLAAQWLRTDAVASGLPIAFYGASTGAGAAFWAAADPSAEIVAVVSCGGRPELAEDRLEEVRVPVLLIVGGEDSTVLSLNRRAQARLRPLAKLVVVPGATHLFEEPGALAEIAITTRRWLLRHLIPSDGSPVTAPGALADLPDHFRGRS